MTVRRHHVTAVYSGVSQNYCIIGSSALKSNIFVFCWWYMYFDCFFIILQLDSSKMEDFKEQINLYPFHPFMVLTSKSFIPYNDQNSNASKKKIKHIPVFCFMLLAVSYSKQKVCSSFCPLKLIVCIDCWFLVDKIWKPSWFLTIYALLNVLE